MTFILEDDHPTLVGKTNNGINNHYQGVSPVKNCDFPASHVSFRMGSSSHKGGG